MPGGIAAPFYYTHKKRKTSPAGTRGDYYYLNSWRNDTLTILICGNCLHYCGYTANSTCSDLHTPGKSYIPATIGRTCNAGIGVGWSIVVDLQLDIYLWLAGSDTYQYGAAIGYLRWNTRNLHSQLGRCSRLWGRSRVG